MYAFPMLIKALMSRDAPSLQYASSDLRKDTEAVLIAVSNAGSALQYATSDMRKDREVVLAAVRNQGSAHERSWVARRRSFCGASRLTRHHLAAAPALVRVVVVKLDASRAITASHPSQPRRRPPRSAPRAEKGLDAALLPLRPLRLRDVRGQAASSL